MATADHLRAARSADMRHTPGARGQGDRLLDEPGRPHPGKIAACLGFLYNLRSNHGLRLLLPGRGSGHPGSRTLRLGSGLSAVGAERVRVERRRVNRLHPSGPCHPRPTWRRGWYASPDAWRRHPIETAAPLRVGGDPITQYRQRENQGDSPVASHGSTQPVLTSVAEAASPL